MRHSCKMAYDPESTELLSENDRLLSVNNLERNNSNIRRPNGHTIINIPNDQTPRIQATKNPFNLNKIDRVVSKNIHMIESTDKKEKFNIFCVSQKVEKNFFTSQIVKNRTRLVEIAEKNIFQLISELDSLNKKQNEEIVRLLAERILPSVNSTDLARLKKSKRTKIIGGMADDFHGGLDLLASRIVSDSTKSKEKMITFGISHQKFQHIQIIAKLAANQERKNATYKDKLSALSRDLDNVLNNLEPGSSNQNEDSGASRQMNKIENAIQTTTFEAESSISKYDWTIMTIKKLFIVKLLELTKLLHENISSNQGQEVENYVSNYYISPLTKKRNQEKEMIELLNKLNAELIRISIVDEHQTRELKVFNKQELRNRKELCESYQLDSKGENRKDLIIEPLQNILSNWTQLPIIQSFEMLLEENFSVDALKDFLWRLRKANEIPICEKICTESLKNSKNKFMNDKWSIFEAQAANFLKQSFRSALKNCKEVERLQIGMIINQINVQLIPTVEKEKIQIEDYKNSIKVLQDQLNQRRIGVQESEVDRDQILYNQMNYGNLSKVVADLTLKKKNYSKTEINIARKEARLEKWKKKSSSFTRLLLIECTQHLLSAYAKENGHTIFQLIFNNIPKQRIPGDMIELIKALLHIVFACGNCLESELIFQELDDFLSSNFREDTKISVLKCFLKYLPLQTFDLNKNQLDWPGTRMITLTQILKFSEFKDSFKDYLRKLQLKHNTQNSKNSKKYQKELQEDCINVAKIAQQNKNEDLIRFLIYHESTDLETKFLLLVIVCKAGYHRTLRELLAISEKDQISANVAKKMMFGVLDAIMLRMGQKSCESFINDRVDHYLCFDLLYNNETLSKHFGFLFMKNALLSGYDEVVLKLFQNGYKIDTTNDAGESFLTVCGSPDMLKRVLDNSVFYDNPEDPNKYLKIDYKYLKLAEKVQATSSLQLIQHNKQFQPLISHPALANYIEIKYKKFQALHSLNFSIFFIFLLIKMASVLLYITYEHQALYILSITYSLCPTYVLVRECIQIKKFYGWNYIRNNENWVEILLIFLGFLGVLAMFTDEEVALKGVSGFFMIFAITELLFLLAKISTQTRVTMKMFSAVANIYMKLSLLILIVVAGFSYSFYLIFALPADQHNNAEDYNNFQGARYAFVKTLIMLTGEFDASSILLLDFHKFIFTVVFVLVAVTIFNFLNALAFGEIASLKSSADFEILREKLRKVCTYEEVFDRSKFGVRWLDKIIYKFSKDIDGLDAVYIECQNEIRATRRFYSKKIIKLRKKDQQIYVMTIKDEVFEQLEEVARKNGVVNMN